MAKDFKILAKISKNGHTVAEPVFKVKLLPTTCETKCFSKNRFCDVVAQLAEWLLPMPEVRGSNPVVRKKYNYNICS